MPVRQAGVNTVDTPHNLRIPLSPSIPTSTRHLAGQKRNEADANGGAIFRANHVVIGADRVKSLQAEVIVVGMVHLHIVLITQIGYIAGLGSQILAYWQLRMIRIFDERHVNLFFLASLT
jgi:hypothetical protein